MKGLIVNSLIILFFITQSVQAQNIFKWISKDPVKRSENLTVWMVGKLNLDKEQTTKMKEVNYKYALMMQPILESDDDIIDKWVKSQEINDRRQIETEAILNQEQLAIVEEKKNKMKQLVERMLKRLSK